MVWWLLLVPMEKGVSMLRVTVEQYISTMERYRSAAEHLKVEQLNVEQFTVEQCMFKTMVQCV